MSGAPDSLELVARDIIACEACPRLREHCEQVARVKRRAWRDWDYWGKPVPGFGDPNAKVLVVGLAPGAHGANRTGRVFTGDKSGDLLFKVLYRAGFANQPTSSHVSDGLKLDGIWISASCRCAPPDNKPSPEEVRRCRPFLEREMTGLTKVRIVVALGKLAFDNYLAIVGMAGRSRMVFGHGAEFPISGCWGHERLIASYHPSMQNTLTGRLTEDMFQKVFGRAHALAAET